MSKKLDKERNDLYLVYLEAKETYDNAMLEGQVTLMVAKTLRSRQSDAWAAYDKISIIEQTALLVNKQSIMNKEDTEDLAKISKLKAELQLNKDILSIAADRAIQEHGHAIKVWERECERYDEELSRLDELNEL